MIDIKKNELDSLFKIGVVLFFWASTVVMYITFLTAYSSPYKMTEVYINQYGEATLELWVMSILLLVGSYFTYYIVKDYLTVIEALRLYVKQKNE
jgi:hypothetical protein